MNETCASEFKKTRQAMYYIYRNFEARLCNNIVVEKQYVLHILSVYVCVSVFLCLCSLRYPAYNAHAPYCHLWPVRLYSIFFALFLKRHDFRKKKKVIESKMCVLTFATSSMRKISHSKRD